MRFCIQVVKNASIDINVSEETLIIVALFLIFPVIAGLLDMMIENLPVMELSLLFGSYVFNVL